MSRRSRAATAVRVAELLRSGDAGGAERVGRAVLKREPRNADAWNLHAMAALEAGSLAKARTRLERAVAIRPDSSVFHSNLGAVLERMGDLESSYRAHDRALALDREPADNWFNHGLVLLRLGRPGEAAASLQAARDRDPADPEIRLNLGRALELTGDGEAALREYRDALARATTVRRGPLPVRIGWRRFRPMAGYRRWPSFFAIPCMDRARRSPLPGSYRHSPRSGTPRHAWCGPNTRRIRIPRWISLPPDLGPDLGEISAARYPDRPARGPVEEVLVAGGGTRLRAAPRGPPESGREGAFARPQPSEPRIRRPHGPANRARERAFSSGRPPRRRCARPTLRRHPRERGAAPYG